MIARCSVSLKPFHERSSPFSSHPVAGVVAENCSGDGKAADPLDLEVSARGEEARPEKSGVPRDGETGVLEERSQEDEGVAVVDQERREPIHMRRILPDLGSKAKPA